MINGQKVWISRVQHSDWMILLARTTPLADVKKKTSGMSIFMVDLRQAEGSGMTVRPIANMVNHETNELFFENLEIPEENLIGQEGEGFRYILDGLNARAHPRSPPSASATARWFIDRATPVRGRAASSSADPIGQNQGVQFPIARRHTPRSEAAALMRSRAG